MYKHYLKKDINNNITKVFSSFEDEFDGTEILYKETNERYAQLEKGIIDPETGLYNYKWDGTKLVEIDNTLAKERAIDINNLKMELEITDVDIPRGVEDVIDALDANNIFKKSDMPVIFQQKLSNKKDLRQQLSTLIGG